MGFRERNSTFSLGGQELVSKKHGDPRGKEPWRSNMAAGTSSLSGGARYQRVRSMWGNKQKEWPGNQGEDCSLFIDGLTEATTYNQLKGHFTKFGLVSRTFVQK